MMYKTPISGALLDRNDIRVETARAQLQLSARLSPI